METIIVALVMTLSSNGSFHNLKQAAAAETRTGQIKPPFKVLTLACSTGVFHTTVTNNTNTAVPDVATITAHGREAVCSFTVKGPLAPGKSINLPGCPEPVRTCVASAKWPTDQ